jgi:hypothetical protein
MAGDHSHSGELNREDCSSVGGLFRWETPGFLGET